MHMPGSVSFRDAALLSSGKGVLIEDGNVYDIKERYDTDFPFLHFLFLALVLFHQLIEYLFEAIQIDL